MSREPGEDDGTGYGGEYYETPPAPVVESYCACPKPPGCYGSRGFHFTPAGAVYERCPAMTRAVVKQPEPTKRGRRR